MSTTVFLIRHGETEWSDQKRYCGFTDIELNEKGRWQARRLATRLQEEKIHRIYSSDMKRTLQCAKIVFKHKPVEGLFHLREMNFGVFEGLTYQDIMEKYPLVYRNWLENPLDTAIPQGESLHSLAARVGTGLREILSQNSNKAVAVFTHGGPIRVILTDILKVDLKEIWRIEPRIASLSILEFAKGKGRIYLLNDISYLDG
ncbi:MAG: histidine phosphatase family protein [Deltaproteobacteria bacterium]|nr:histidine phosphatase family protein [Deltaproteobacteria bacterium]MBW2340851.1 histidine phosphatase family protein [Deltaproteobacteria bacterium]